MIRIIAVIMETSVALNAIIYFRILRLGQFRDEFSSTHY